MRRGFADRSTSFGLLLLCVGLLFLMYGISGVHVVPMVFGALLLFVFWQWERASRFPIVAPSLFANRQLAKTFGLEMSSACSRARCSSFQPCSWARSISPMPPRAQLRPWALSIFVAVIPASGRALDRIGSRDVLIAGTLFTEIGLVIFRARLRLRSRSP